MTETTKKRGRPPKQEPQKKEVKQIIRYISKNNQPREGAWTNEQIEEYLAVHLNDGYELAHAEMFDRVNVDGYGVFYILVK
jgi:hypothetical protein